MWCVSEVRTGGVLRIQDKHFIEWPTAVCNKLIAFRRVTTTTFASHEYGVIEKDESYSAHGLVSRCVKRQYTIYLGDNMPARGRRDKLGRTFDLGVQILHLVRIKYAQVCDGRANITSAVYKMSILRMGTERDNATGDGSRLLDV